MSTFGWAAFVAILATTAFFHFRARALWERELATHLEILQAREQTHHFELINSVGQLQKATEEQDRLIMALWHGVYGTVGEAEENLVKLADVFSMAPNWRLHPSGFYMVRDENFPWCQRATKARWDPKLPSSEL